jgi:hypothetical protein
MNNEWLNSLRSRMEDHEEDIPDGLWDDIRDELFSGEEEKGAVFSLASNQIRLLKWEMQEIRIWGKDHCYTV